MLLQIGIAKEPDLPDVPLAYDSITNPVDRPVAEIFFGQLGLARPILSAPEFPLDRLAAVRKAFMEMVGDRQFLAEAEKSKLELHPADYRAVQRFVALTESLTPDVKRRLFGGLQRQELSPRTAARCGGVRHCATARRRYSVSARRRRYKVAKRVERC